MMNEFTFMAKQSFSNGRHDPDDLPRLRAGLPTRSSAR
jgi:hypothetical protein